MIEVVKAHNVSYSYGNRQILEKVSFVIYKHDRIALLGKNGSGKSTLIRGLNKLIHSSEGEMTIDGEELRKGHDSEIYTIFTEANDQIIMSTVYAELSLGLLQQNKPQAEIDAIIETNLMRFGLLQYIHDDPYNLSTGEKKKLLLATALSLNPGLLVLDEPFSGLDMRSKNELVLYIRDIPCTQLLVTHEYDYARECCNRAFVLHEKKLVCFDNVASLLDDKGLLRDYELI